MKKRLQKRSILTILLTTVLALAMGLAVLFASPLFGKKMDVQADELGEPVVTYYLGQSGLNDPAHNVYYRENMVSGWGDAVTAAKDAYLTNPSDYVKVVLTKNWVAEGGKFGEDANFDSGRIWVPNDANIMIDLNGYELNRGLTSGTENGQVILVNGVLTVVDGSDGLGVITGGYNVSSSNVFGGGVYVNGGTLNLRGGSVTGNKAGEGSATVYGGGVAVNGGTFNMYGGSVSANEITSSASYGGGVCVYHDGTFNMYGGLIQNHTATYGGGVASYDVSGTAINIEDGIIYKNVSTQNGGGIYVHKNSADTTVDAYIKGGDINNNSSNMGGGVYVDGNVAICGGSLSYNNATSGGGVYVAGGASLSVAGTPVVKDNYLTSSVNSDAPVQNNVVFANSGKLTVADVLEDGAEIYVNTSSGEFTKGYGKVYGQFVSVDGKEATPEANPTNGAYVYADVTKYFVSDSGKNVVVLSTGELGVTTQSVAFTLTYASGDKAVDSLYNYVSGTYGDEGLPTAIKANSTTQTVESNAKVYTLSVALEGSMKVEYHVIIMAKDLTGEDVTITLPDATYSYNKGTKHQPVPTSVKYGSVTLNKETDYKLDYENNENAGEEAAVIVNFCGNYTGSATAYFTITPSTSKATAVQWQVDVNGNGTWADVSAVSEGAFTYNGENQAGKIRAKLTDTDGSYAVYANDVEFTADTVEQNKSMYLEFGGQGDEFVDAGIYTVTVMGHPNYDYNAGQSTTLADVKMNRKALTVSADDYGKYTDSNYIPLWRLQIGEGESVDYSVLQTTATYVIGEGADAEVIKNAEGYFARYRDVEMYLILNGEYTLASGMKLGELLAMAGDEVTYVHTASDGATTKGVRGAVISVHTAATFTINTNYELNGGTDNQITLEFEWKIVTIGNNLRTQSGDEIQNTNLGSWTFANPEGLLGDAFRAEHGNTVIYTYYKLEDVATGEYDEDGNPAYATEEQLVDMFALTYSNNTLSAIRHFYKVSLVDGEYVLGDAINDENYLYTFNYQLRVGNYKMVVTIPELEPTTEEHAHWWNRESANDHGVMYYELSYEFNFTVNVYEAALVNGMIPNMTIECLTTTVEYNGLGNNVPVTIVTLFDNLVLIEGVDYIISTTGVNVGIADIIIEGISFKGTITLKNKYEIVKGRNSWTQVPSIMQWTYMGYDKAVNLINATPALLDTVDGMWFSVAYDGAGENLVDGLHKFTIEQGVVDDDVAAILKMLPAGQYFLIGQVDGTDNYYALEAQVIPFTVFSATNSWEVSPTVNSWTEGKFNENESYISVSAMFGDAHVRIEDLDGNVYYDAYGEDVLINKLAEAKAGRYILTAWVDGTDDYSEVNGMFMFDIFEKPGMPWWASLLIAVGALAVAAIIILILWKTGVFQIVTEKFVVAIRTRASVEATIASVRAAKMMEEGRKSVEDAKRRERLEKAREALEAKRNMTPEERAAELEAKAKEEAEKAEKLRARSEANRARAEKMRGTEANAAQSEAAASDATDTPTDK